MKLKDLDFFSVGPMLSKDDSIKFLRNIIYSTTYGTGKWYSFFNGFREKYQDIEELFNNLFSSYNVNSFYIFKRAPTASSSIDISSIDLDFFSKYGNRKVSSIVSNLPYIAATLAGSDFSIVYAADFNVIYSVIYKTFYDKWQSLYDTIIKEYDPIKPFNIVLNETSTNVLTVDKDVSTYEDNDSTYGSNTNMPKPTDMSKGTRKNEYSRSNPTSRDYSRVGNIGNRSSAELIMQEREKLKFRLQNIVFEDILSIIARNSYGD